LIRSVAPPVLPRQTAFYAGFWLRTVALMIDLVLITGCLAVVRTMWLFPLVLLLYFASFLAARGATPGGLAAGIRCVRVTGEPVNWASAIARCLASIFSVFPLGLGYFWMAWDERKQGWHDKIAGTVMVRTRRGA
jgi:uncharacterized RDD family membrane protein YckC